MPKAKNLLKCGVDCILNQGCRHPRMDMEGDPKTATILFVGEAPGQDEDKLGIPFVGEAGKLLRSTLATHKITNFCITNSVRCRPPKNRDPSAKELQSCKQYLLDDIASMPHLDLIVPLGRIALQTLLKSKSISQMSGKTIIGADGRTYLPVYHPAYILYNRNELKVFEEHIGRIPQAMTGSLIDYSDMGKYDVITTLEAWDALVDSIIDKGYCVYDIETTDKTPFRDDIRVRCIGFSVAPRTASVLPLDAAIWTDSQWDKIYKDLSMILMSNRIGKVGHNVKFDNLFMEQLLGIPVHNTIWDTKHSQFLLNENESNELKDMSWKYSKLGGYEKLLLAEPQVAEKERLYPYCATDCDLTHRIYLLHNKELSKELHYLMTNLMLPAMDALVKLELKGIRIDETKLNDCEIAVDKMINTLDIDIHKEKSIQDFESANGLFNPNSYLQVGEVLFKYEGLKSISLTKKTKRPSTSSEVLEQLATQSNLCRLLSELSLYTSMKSKMIKGLREYAYKGRIHTIYLQARTVTGRTASKTPNMQNVTKGEKDMVGIRDVFIADPGYILVEFDFNQHELRCMAEEAGDGILAKAVIGGDVHASTAQSIFDIPNNSTVSVDQRRAAKCLNFGLIYGITEHGIVNQLKCSELTAKMYIDRFFQTYTKTKQWMDATAAFARENGYVKSRTGRIRHFPIWNELDDKSVREGINMPVQSLASDILLYGMIAVSRLLAKKKSYICLEIHDSIVCNIHKDEMDLIPMIQDILTTACLKHIRFILPLKVDVKIGQSWGTLKRCGTSEEQEEDRGR